MQTLAEFFTAQTPSRPLAVCRLMIGLVCALRAYMQYGQLQNLYSGNVIPARNFEALPDLPPFAILPFILVWFVSSLAFAAGWRTRLSGSIIGACAAYQLLLDGNLYANNFYLLFLMLFLLTVAGPSKHETIPRWASLLLRLQVTLVYIYSAAFKLNTNFLTGQTTKRAMRFPEAWHSTPIPAVLAISAEVIEIFVPIALWIPKLRRSAFVAGFLLHLGILVGMERRYTGAMLIFGTLMLAPFILFLEHPRHSRLVIWDGNCSFCSQMIEILKRLDWLQIHRFEASTDPHLEEIKLKFDNQTLGGFEAMREILCLQPLSYLWAPLLSLPFVNSLGSRSYRAIAARRKCALSSR